MQAKDTVMRKTVISMLICCTVGSPAAWAAETMKPGLWEMSMKSDAFKNMPKMSAEQMAQMRKMGVNVPQMQDGAMVSRVCITKEMAEREQAPMGRHDRGCQARNFQRSGNAYSSDIVCDGPDMKGTGKVKGTFAGDTGFTSTYDFKGTAHGRPVDNHHESSGKWLAADCGAVKPVTPMQPAK
ncbi:DUF3617 domain-containing protein [Janthinobacterium sp. 17J80-10]|uniref:DUF3617 domain-containing protein n=1 Tax=Janthinobacterium sp. 17J80-10 TaxID=2497863 RepID=UPI0010054CC8|nr:DUF3617 domain-containing protein [Janthinobacterium sp. 17J80-10]QAU35420.1 DUF3617 domain-containing protein [Janthinobacterium sp. 17J80-10]